jgi:hypothetical protein
MGYNVEEKDENKYQQGTTNSSYQSGALRWHQTKPGVDILAAKGEDGQYMCEIIKTKTGLYGN